MPYILNQINDYTYSLKIHGSFSLCKPLYKTILKIIKNAHYDRETESIFFAAEQVVKLETIVNTLHHNLTTCIQMLDCLATQMTYLKTLNYGFYGFNLNGILVIDNHYIVCDTSFTFPVEENEFTFVEPINMPKFSSPEINKLTNLPSIINYKCCYYSLGMLAVYCLLKSDNLLKEDILKPIANSKMYWFLKRCLHKNIDERVLLLI